MAGVNKVILVGNLGRDPEVRALESGRKVAKFPLATTETYRDRNGERQEITEWHNIVFWGPIAEVIERYLKKGNQIYVEGSLRTRSYEDKDGITKYITEVNGQNMTMLGGPRNSDGSNTAGSSSSVQDASSDNVAAVEQEDTEDDLPF